jgi:hypothetical protein
MLKLLLPVALFNPKMSIVTQKHHPYTGNQNSETPGDRENAFLPCGDVLGHKLDACLFLAVRSLPASLAA